MRSRTVIAAGAALAVVTAAAPALADGSATTTVSTATVTASRQLRVLDLAGNPLQQLDLKPGMPQPFRVEVSDTNVAAPNKPFTVQAQMNNLYATGPEGNVNYTQQDIPATDVTLQPLGSRSLSALTDITDKPLVTVTGSLKSCLQNTDLLSALGIGSGSGLLGSLSTLVDGLTSTLQPICKLLGDTGVDVGTVSGVAGTVTERVTGLTDLNKLPFGLTNGTGGPFPSADYANGIGKGHGPGNSSTPGDSLTVMHGSPTNLSGLLDALPSPGTLPLLSTSAGGNALTSLSNLVGALQSSTSSTLRTLATDLQQVTDPALKLDLLEGLRGTLTSGLSTLTEDLGSYNSFPTLTVQPPAGTPDGAYSGTLTITMVQE